MLTVVVLVSGRVFPRSICVQFHVPVKNIIDEKFGFGIATGVGAGAGAAAESNGEATSPRVRAKALNAMSAACFILLTFHKSASGRLRARGVNGG
jgi:hypothetical protein